MYIPAAFQETDRDRLHAFIEGHSFGLLVSTLGGQLFATHLPLLLDRAGGCLLGHVAKANPHWRGLDGQEVLVVFSGPHAYISPALYEADHVVPTWNYVAVHAYGMCRLVEDPAALEDILKQMVAVYEGARANPWSLDTATAYFRKMAQAVVGLRVEVSRLEGKWKLNQNHPPERREKVRRALEQSADQNEQAIARLMAERPRFPGGCSADT
jgi:transcriptional regulator